MKFDVERLKEMKWIFLFYFIGDTFTTCLMISTGYGQEGNPFVAHLLNNYGYISLVILKIIAMIIIYNTYSCINTKKNLWKITKTCIVFVGIFACTNNLLLFIMQKSLIEYILPFCF